MVPTSYQQGPRARLDNRHVQFTCESRASRPACSYPFTSRFDANKIPGPIVNRGWGWTVRNFRVTHAFFSLSLSLSFRLRHCARVAGLKNAVVCVVVRPGDYAVARGPFSPQSPRLRPVRHSKHTARGPRAHAHTHIRVTKNRLGHLMSSNHEEKPRREKRGKEMIEVRGERSGRRKRASSCSNRFGHANARCSSLFALIRC